MKRIDSSGGELRHQTLSDEPRSSDEPKSTTDPSGSNALRALTSSALALGGIAGNATADTPIDRYYADYNYSTYSEDDLPKSNGLPLGETGRYEIEMQQFTLGGPLTERMDFGLEMTFETMTGASPFYVLPDAAGAPIQVMSGASISEDRRDISLTTNRYYDNARLGFSTGISTENDYDSMSFGFDGETHFNEKNTTLSAGLGVSLDSIEPTGGGTGTIPVSEDKKSYTFYTGLSQILDRRSTIQTSMTLKHNTGYLSDPYKQAFVFGGTFLGDTRPDTRNQFTWLTRYRRHIEEIDATIHADYAFYLDDWDVSSHTVELAWIQKLRESLTVTPSMRYYSQNEAEFFKLFYAVNPGVGADASSDYRLSSYGAFSFGLKGEYVFQTRFTGDLDMRAVLSWDRYTSSGALAHVNVDEEHPGLVSYSVVTFGFSIQY